MVEPEAKFHSELFVRLKDEIESHFPDYDEPKIEEDVEGRRADIYVPSKRTGEVIIEVKRDDVNPREREVVKQAYDYARDKDTEYFATCNSRDFFLFDTRQGYDLDEFDYYYFDLRNLSVEEFVDELLLVVNYLFHEDELPEQAEKKKVLGILQSFHSTIWEPYEALARDKYESSEPFRQKFENWARENDYEPDADKTFKIAAKQYAYLLTNKVLFYEFVRRKTPDEIPTESGFPLDSIHEHTTLEMMEEHLRDCFDSIVEEIDYEAVFDDEASLFEEFPQNRKTLMRIEDFLNNIVNADIGEIDEDLLGGIYEELIPEQERKRTARQNSLSLDCACIHAVRRRFGGRRSSRPRVR
ncbi:MAG: hypothetical protein U5J64_03800 [Halobacteriales archaeon]|nr:hypothetical protein [Halobacteriales archaeon]